jgi:bacillithiol biosynthesis cysteine-adding enzyme BshC
VTTGEKSCYGTPEGAGLRVERLPFERVPQQSRLFLDYLRDPVSLQKFYPNAIRFHYETQARAREVLDAHETSRDALASALGALNERWGAGEKTLESVARLRSPEAVAVVSGQQVGLFTGPLYTVYKALSAVKLARCLTERGVEAVPVFWMATEDHDWPEVQEAEVLSCNGDLSVVSLPASLHSEGAPVGTVLLDGSIEEAITRLLTALPTTEFTPALEKILRDSYRPGVAYGDAFARMLSALTHDFGLVLLDPLDPRLKRLAAPLYERAARRAPEIAAALVERSRELEAAGYHAQVHTTADAFPLFVHDAGGVRRAVVRNADGRYQAKGTDSAWTLEELAEAAAREPERFSPNVTLRAVVQDYLLPTVAYFGGAAEVAYFAQTAEVYRLLGRPVTPIFHRASMTIVERSVGRTLERYQLKVEDFFEGLEPVVARVVEEHLGRDVAQAFARAEGAIGAALEELQGELGKFDPTLGDALKGGRRKIEHQLEGLRARFHRSQIDRDEVVRRQLERAAATLYPGKALQERHVNVTSLLARHGLYAMDWVFNAIDPGASDHEVVFL